MVAMSIRINSSRLNLFANKTGISVPVLFSSFLNGRLVIEGRGAQEVALEEFVCGGGGKNGETAKGCLLFLGSELQANDATPPYDREK
jgi:hypothetical protein